jgi:hypothetical protein
VTGTLNLNTVQITNDRYLTTNVSGDEVASIRYDYTVGS